MLNIRNWIAIFGLLFTQVACTAELAEINAQELEKLITAGVTVIDVRTPGEWKKTGIVEGSIPIMFFDEKRKAHAQEWMQQASMHIKPDSPVAIICRSGNRSKVVGNFLIKQHGYQNVYNASGGIKAWVAKGNKTVKAK